MVLHHMRRNSLHPATLDADQVMLEGFLFCMWVGLSSPLFHSSELVPFCGMYSIRVFCKHAEHFEWKYLTRNLQVVFKYILKQCLCKLFLH